MGTLLHTDCGQSYQTEKQLNLEPQPSPTISDLQRLLCERVLTEVGGTNIGCSLWKGN